MLNGFLPLGEAETTPVRRGVGCAYADDPYGMLEGEENIAVQLPNLIQWTTGDGRLYLPAGRTMPRLIPGAYEIRYGPSVGVYFEKFPVKTEGLLRFPHSNADRLLHEIQAFWGRETLYRDYGLAFKRGFLLWGPAGSGKSSTILLVMQDIVERAGVVFRFTIPSLFREGLRLFRQVEPDTPLLVVMEDLDSILAAYGETEVLNVLDGIDVVDKVVFLGSSNYPENLPPRLLSRPSRLDRRFKIDHPDAEARQIYLRHLIGETKVHELQIDLERWTQDTDQCSLAKLKELFIAVTILGDNYEKALDTLRSMNERICSDEEYERPMGLAAFRHRGHPATSTRA